MAKVCTNIFNTVDAENKYDSFDLGKVRTLKS